VFLALLWCLLTWAMLAGPALRALMLRMTT
jgi:hypothetical protein